MIVKARKVMKMVSLRKAPLLPSMGLLLAQSGPHSEIAERHVTPKKGDNASGVSGPSSSVIPLV